MKKLTFKSAAEKILRESDTPLSPAAIVEKALEQAILETGGKTPVASMGAQLYTDINNKPDSKFIKVGKGLFSLKNSSKSSPKTTEELIDRHNKKVVENFTKKLSNFDPFLFEQLVGDLLSKIGYEDVQVTKRSADGGIDVVANLKAHGLTNVKTIVQVKRYKNNVPDSTIRELRGSAEVDQRGLVITTSDFTKPAVLEASAKNKMPVSLVNGTKLVELLLQYQVGVTRETREVLSIDNEYFNELGSTDNQPELLNKARSVWPLPGGISTYFSSLNTILKFLKDSKKSSSVIEWFKEHFENVESPKTITGYLGVLRTFGLITTQNSIVSITPEGKQFSKKPTEDALFDLINVRVFGFEEVLQFINESEVPKSEVEVKDYLVSSFDIDWKSTQQTTYRLLWLWNLKLINRNDDGKYERL